MIRRKRKKSAKLLKIIFLSLVVFIVLAIFLLIRFKPFTIKQIEIQNANTGCINEAQLKTSLSLYGQNFFLLDTNKLTKSLKEKFICLKNINYSRSFPNKIVVEIVRREPAAILVNLKEKRATPSSLLENIATPSAREIIGNLIVDAEGVIFSKDTEDLSIPKIYTQNLDIPLGKNLKDDLIKNSLKILDKIKTFGIEHNETWILEKFFIINGKPKVIFRLDEKVDTQLASLQLILTEAKIDLKELEFIDLRFDKPIVKYTPKVN